MLARNIRHYPPRRRKTKKWPYLLIMFVIVLVGGGYYLTRDNHKQEVTKQIADVSKFIQLRPEAGFSDPSAQIQEIIGQYPKLNISVSVLDARSGATISEQNSQPVNAASVNKLVTAYALLSEVEKGRVNLNSSLGDYTVGWQLEQMINQSNNESWELLNAKLGVKKIEYYAQSLGLASYDYYDNTLSVADASKILFQLYNGKLLNEENTKKLLSYMQHTDKDDLATGVIPDEITTYHKYGYVDQYLNDAAIIEARGPVIVTIFTSGQNGPNYDAQREAIQKISRAVYESRR